MNWKSSVCICIASMFSTYLATAQTNVFEGTPGNPATSGTTQTNGSLRLATDTGNSQVLDMGLFNATPYGAWLQSGNGNALGASSPLVLNPVGGNVGVGTTNPTTAFQVTSGNLSVQQPSGDPSFVLYKGDGEVSNLYFGIANTGQTSSGGTPNRLSFYTNTGAAYAGSSEKMVISNSGDVGIGTTSPSQALDVAGSIIATGTISGGGGDYAESVDVTGNHDSYSPGDILVIDPKAPGKFLKSAEPYSTAVLGIYSTKPGVTGRRQITPKEKDEVPMAMVGIVPTKVSAENGAIAPGDLLVTSSTPGYAMKATDRSRIAGAVIGKALGNLDSGTGTIEVGITLQ